MLAFDVGANRGDWTRVALDKGYKVIALEPGKVIRELIANFIYDERVTILNLAAYSSDFALIRFYECVEDGLSTISKDWLTDPSLPYAGKEFYQTTCTTITIDSLVKLYGEPDLIKVDVEGAEWDVLRGMTKKYGKLALEWTKETIDEHNEQIKFLASLGYTKVGPQFIEHHLLEPKTYYPIEQFDLREWRNYKEKDWEEIYWYNSGLRPTADVGMLWFS